MKNEKGIIALAVILSMLLVISALAVFGVVSGRFGLSYHLNNRIQALRDAETASFVTYQLLRDGDIVAGTHDFTINTTNVNVVVSGTGDSVKAKVTY